MTSYFKEKFYLRCSNLKSRETAEARKILVVINSTNTHYLQSTTLKSVAG